MTQGREGYLTHGTNAQAVNEKVDTFRYIKVKRCLFFKRSRKENEEVGHKL